MAKRPPARRKTDRLHHDHQHQEQHNRQIVRLLDEVATRICALEAQGKVLLMGKTEQKAGLKRIEAGLTNISGDIRRLKGRVVAGMPQADVDEVQAAIDALADAVDVVANDPENPDDAPVEDPPAEA